MDKHRFVLATSNLGKISEMQSEFALRQWEILPQSAFNLPPVEETGLSFIENAIIKARHACQYTGLAAVADDSGIEVTALNGAPGIYSARYAGLDATAQQNNQKLLETLTDFPDPQDRKACFVCVMVYMKHPQDPMPIIGIGRWHGIILTEPCGQLGHGYDPIFFVPETGCTAAEMSVELKNQLSHRGKAIRMLVEQLVGEKV